MDTKNPRIGTTLDPLNWTTNLEKGNPRGPVSQYESKEEKPEHDTAGWAPRDSNPARRIKSPVLYLMS
jgi:hypothetical protein